MMEKMTLIGALCPFFVTEAMIRTIIDQAIFRSNVMLVISALANLAGPIIAIF